jgi:hypothetical protein
MNLDQMKVAHEVPLFWADASVRAVVLLVAFSAPALAARLEFTNDPAAPGPGQFAAEELRREAAACGMAMVRPEMLADHEVVKCMTIDEKIEFWRWVMQSAAVRGIQVYFFTWGAEGKQGIRNDLGSEIAKQYFCASVREFVKTYRPEAQSFSHETMRSAAHVAHDCRTPGIEENQP